MSGPALTLMVRSAVGVVVDRAVQSVTAEDESGWFGIFSGRSDLVAVLPPGILVFRDADAEGFVAESGGILDLRGARCRVLCHDALWSRDLDAISADVARFVAARRKRHGLGADIVDQLVREALRRMAGAERA
jgi:F-type H+-transporting ATPase subunit epsilon